jgi:hypothetical protein
MARPAAVFILSDDALELAKHNSERGGRRMREKALIALQLHFDSVETAADPDLIAAASTSSSMFDSDLAVSILKEYLLGDKSAAEVQRLAYLAYRDQLQLLKKDAVAQGRDIQDQTSKTLKALASMGELGEEARECQ